MKGCLEKEDTDRPRNKAEKCFCKKVVTHLHLFLRIMFFLKENIILKRRRCVTVVFWTMGWKLYDKKMYPDSTDWLMNNEEDCFIKNKFVSGEFFSGRLEVKFFSSSKIEMRRGPSLYQSYPSMGAAFLYEK